MVDPGLFHILLLSVAAVVTGGLAIYAWRNSEEAGARPLSAAMVAVTWWTMTEIFALSQTGGSHLVWERVQWAAIAVAPLFFFFFIVDFTGHEWVLSPRLVPLFFVIPVLTIGLVLTNPIHQLMWTEPVPIHTGGIVTLTQDFGPWFWVYFAYAYSLLLIGFGLLIRMVISSDYLYLDQTVLIVLGILAPLVGNAVSVFEMAPLPGLDLTPYGFTVTGIAFGNALLRYDLFDLLPATRRLGRQAALVDLNDGIVIVDTDRKILYLNPAAGDILDCEPAEVLGDPVQTLVDTGQLDFDGTNRLAELVRDGRTYEVETAPISDRRGKQVGHTILLYDVTERTRREEDLRVQRDRFRRLERINTVIREVNQALVSASTVEDLQQTIVETLVTPELYDEVWLGTTATEGPPVRMTAGDEGPELADSNAVPPGLESPDTLDTVEGHLPTDPEPTGDGSWATVAVVYGRTVYGAIALHTDRETGFDEREFEVLEELGETIGHAFTSIERTHLLVADTHVHVEIESTDRGSLLVALAAETGIEWTLDGLVPATGGDLVAYLSADDTAADADVAAAHPGVSDVRPLATDGGTTLEVRASDGMLAHPLVEYGANVRTAAAAEGRCRLAVELAPDANVRRVLRRVREEFPDTELAVKREVEPTDQPPLPDETSMTERQREALEAAFRAGYFDWPRESTAEEVATSLDIASATLHSHLRKAEQRLMAEFFEE